VGGCLIGDIKDANAHHPADSESADHTRIRARQTALRRLKSRGRLLEGRPVAEAIWRDHTPRVAAFLERVGRHRVRPGGAQTVSAAYGRQDPRRPVQECRDTRREVTARSPRPPAGLRAGDRATQAAASSLPRSDSGVISRFF